MQYGGKIVTNGLIFCLDVGSEKTFVPTSTIPVTSGLVMWMDAADDNAFTYSSGTTVSQWRDKSSSGYHMTPKSGGPTRSAFLNSRNVLTFTNSQTIGNNSINLVNSSYSIFLVSRLTGGANSRTLTADFNLSGSNWLLGGWGGSVNQYYAEGWVQNGNYTADTAWSINMGDRNAASDQASFYLNGSTIVTNSAGSSAGPNSLGINWFSSEMSNCEVAEIIVYNKLLSETERRLVHSYLARKWNLSNGESILFDRSENRFGVNCVNGATINTDKGGNIAFDGTNDHASFTSATLPISGNSARSIFAWIKSTSTFTCYVSTGTATNSQSFNLVKYSNNIGVMGYNLDYYPTTGSSGKNVADGNWHYVGVSFNGTNLSMYVDGILDNTSGTFTYSTTGQNNYIARSSHVGNENYVNGNIAIVKIYNRALSASEVLQNFTATRRRFGL